MSLPDPGSTAQPAPESTSPVRVPNVRNKPPWEAQVISICITAVVVVLTICVIIGMIGLLIFGLNVLSHHTG